MAKSGKQFTFDRRVELVLANIETAREILRIADRSEEWEESWDGFKKALAVRLADRIPALKGWRQKSSYADIWFWLTSWQVVKGGDPICIGVTFQDVLEYYMIMNPKVYLYVPPEWKKYDRFISEIRKQAESLGGHWETDDEDGSGLYCYVELRGYGNGKSFLATKYMDEIIDRVSELVKFKATIDRVIRQLK